MKERRKAVEDAYNNDMEYYYSASDLPCKKHPSSSSVGICAFCLKDRLVNLVCSDCGEQRLSSCSCSEISPNRNSCTVDVGSFGRVSFLIENEKIKIPNSNSKPKLQEKAEEILVLRRTSSSSVEVKRKGFWRIGKLFRKKKEKECGKSVSGLFDEKSETWMVDHMGVSRSKSLCSFRGGGLFGSEDGGDSIWSGARSSISAARSSGVNGGLVLDSGRRSGFSEAEPRRSGFDGERKDYVLESDNGNEVGFNAVNRRIFSLRESDFKGMDESNFIDLKLELSSESKQEFSAAKMGILADTHSAFGSMRGGDFVAHELGGGVLTSGGGSCRITMNDRGIKSGRKSLKGWRWIFRHHSSWGGSGKNKDEDFRFKT
ncbi:Micronuclear linker histone polyprotein-like protein [Quillaja saponaria]|uniref:Micronuclear linker histone polyprotein-like protein n=1 Tax=Quillaja saponaria TaxID=32244 RepID=A0AAD7KQ78_QUISA|nr:Micronuclear linker histone polyprotein-like protein [Quillaja saponaria]